MTNDLNDLLDVGGVKVQCIPVTKFIERLWRSLKYECIWPSYTGRTLVLAA